MYESIARQAMKSSSNKKQEAPREIEFYDASLKQAEVLAPVPRKFEAVASSEVPPPPVPQYKNSLAVYTDSLIMAEVIATR